METEIHVFKKKLIQFEARRWIGIKEQGGDNAGQIVEMFQATVNAHPSGEAWCVAFAEFCLKQVDDLWDFMNDSSNPRSSLIKTESAMQMWNNSPQECRQDIEPGCVVIWQHYNANGDPTGLGHAGVVMAILDGTKFMSVEGNTNDGSGVTREGDGVYLRQRDSAAQGSMRVMGFLNPWP